MSDKKVNFRVVDRSNLCYAYTIDTGRNVVVVVLYDTLNKYILREDYVRRDDPFLAEIMTRTDIRPLADAFYVTYYTEFVAMIESQFILPFTKRPEYEKMAYEIYKEQSLRRKWDDNLSSFYRKFAETTIYSATALLGVAAIVTADVILGGVVIILLTCVQHHEERRKVIN